MEAARNISSEDNRGAALSALIRYQELPVASVVEWLHAVARIGSDSEIAEVLLQAIGDLPRAEAVRAAFADAVETIDSDPQHNRVAAAFLRHWARGN